MKLEHVFKENNFVGKIYYNYYNDISANSKSYTLIIEKGNKSYICHSNLTYGGAERLFKNWISKNSK